MLDLTESIAPKSDQLNAEDLLAGPRTFTITAVSRGSSDEQPIQVHLAEFPDRPFRPSKTVRRLMVAAWGSDGEQYIGRRMTLYRDPAVRFGGQDVGGIRVSHMSHLAKRLTLALTVTRGKRSPYVVEPLPDEAPREPGITKTQTAALVALLSEQGHDKASAQALMSALVGRQVGGTQELTKAEAAEVIAALEADQRSQQLVEPEPPQAGEPATPPTDEPALWPETATPGGAG